MKKFSLIFFGGVFVFLLPVNFSAAQDSAAAEYMKGKILSAQDAAGTLPELSMAVSLDLEDGWYIYWRMPGDGGLPTTLDWSQSKNIADVKISWPTPERISADGLNSFGYRDDVVFPIVVTPQKPGEAVILTMKISAVACHDICVPQDITMTRVLPAHDPAGTAEKEEIDRAIAAVPAKDETDRLRLETAVLGRDAVAVPVYAVDGVADDADLIVETENSILTQKPELIRDKADATRAVLKVKAPDGIDLTKELFGKKTTITVINGRDAIEKNFSF